jgi:hypothetical protein
VLPVDADRCAALAVAHLQPAFEAELRERRRARSTAGAGTAAGVAQPTRPATASARARSAGFKA